MESELQEWIHKKREDGVCISGSIIQKESIKIYNDLHPIEENALFERQYFFTKN